MLTGLLDVSRRTRAILAALLLLSPLVACGSSDPLQRALEQRARWNVTLLSWSEAADGTLNMSVRLSGPPRSDLSALTVRLLLTDEAGDEVHRFWHTFDLTGIERGGPADVLVRARDVPPGTAGAGIDPVLQPTPEEQAQIPELRDL